MTICPRDSAQDSDWLPARLGSVPQNQALALMVGLAFAIRLYLGLTSYCISGDGVGYLGMARGFATGDWTEALRSVFSPLYPLLIAAAHPVLHDWELAATLISAILGAAAVATIYWMTREVFGRHDLALGAAALAAIHPELAAYSASVRTEAGYIFLMTAAVGLRS